jgi:hypothetical protein
MNKPHEYPIVVVNMSDKPGSGVDTLARLLLKKLEGLAANDPSFSVAIESHGSNQAGSPSWAISMASTGKTRRCLLNEFRFPPAEGPKFLDYFLWVSRAPIRAGKYLWFAIHDSMGTGTRRQKARGLLGKLPGILMLTILVTVLVLSYSYLMLLLSYMFVIPLRRWRLGMVVLYLLALALVAVSFTWQSFLPPLVLWVSQTTQRLLILIQNPELSNLLFPVVAAVLFGGAVSIVVFVLGLLKRIITKADAWMIPAQGVVDFMYLLDPLYAATARVAFEKRLLELVNQQDTQNLFVICEHSGILLAYEVLSRVCPGKINKPVYLLTRSLDLGGLPIDLSTTFWLLAEPAVWPRFAKATPPNLSWHHWRPMFGGEFTLNMNWGQRRIPAVQYESVKATAFRPSYSKLVDRLIALTHQP